MTATNPRQAGEEALNARDNAMPWSTARCRAGAWTTEEVAVRLLPMPKDDNVARERDHYSRQEGPI
jgi:hypothetical protein